MDLIDQLIELMKQHFINGYADTEIDTFIVLMSLLVTFAIGMYIFFVYRIMTRKTFYSQSFNVSLVAMALITAAVILTIQTSVIVSLGMVGALSIVRFRTAIKDPMDLVFLFWAISAGIICGAGFAVTALILSVILTFGLMLLQRVPLAKASMILVVNSTDPDSEAALLEKINALCAFCNVKSRNLTATSLDLVAEVRSAQEGKLVREILDVPGVSAASLITHDGKVTV